MGSVIGCIGIHSNESVRAYLPAIRKMAERMIKQGKPESEAWAKATESQIKVLTSRLDATHKLVVDAYEKEHGEIKLPEEAKPTTRFSTMGEDELDFTRPQAQNGQTGGINENRAEVKNNSTGNTEQPKPSAPARQGLRTLTGREPSPAWERSTVLRTRDEPLTIYRGGAELTPEDFNPERLGYNSGSAPSGRGPHFTDSKDHADYHAERNNGETYKYHLDIRKPFEYDANDPRVGKVLAKLETPADYHAWAKSLQDGTFDGTKYDGIIEYGTHEGEGWNNVIPFHPDQVIPLKDNARASKSESTKPTGNTIDAVSSAVKKNFADSAAFDRLTTVVKNASELPGAIRNSKDFNDNVQGVAHDGRVYLVSDNIKPGQELGVFMHEAGAHLGFDKIMSAQDRGWLADQVRKWSTREDMVGEAAQAALRRGGKSNDEVIAYATEELVNRGVKPVGARVENRWLQKVMKAFDTAFVKLGFREKSFDHQNLIDMAYGAADLAMRDKAKPAESETRMSRSDEERKAPIERAKDVAEKVMGPKGRQFVTDSTNVVKRAAAHTEFLHNIINRLKNDKVPAAGDWYQHVLAQQETRNMLVKKAEVVAGMADKLSNKQLARVDKFLMDSTLDQKWGYQPKWRGDAVKVDTAMEQRWKQLTPDEKQVVDSVFKNNEDNHNMNRELYKQLGVTDILGDQKKMQGPYAALRRTGEYQTVGKSGEYTALEKKIAEGEGTAADARKLEEMKGEEKHFYFAKRETLGQAEMLERSLKGRYAFTDSGEVPRNINDRHMIDPTALRRVMSAIKMDDVKGPVRDQMEQMVRELYASTLEQRDARMAKLHRAGAAGADETMVKSYLNDARAQAGFTAALKHGGDVQDAFYRMQLGAKDASGKRVNQSEVNIVNDHYAAWMKRHNDSLLHTIDNAATTFTTAMQLSTSVGYHLNNALQGAMYTIPHMAATFNDYPAAWRHFAKGYEQMAKITSNWGRDTDLSQVKDPVLRDVLQHAEKQGLLDVGIEENLGHFNRARTGYTVADTASKITHAALHKLRIVASSVERWNRVSSAVAAYGLAVEKGLPHEKAKQYAMDVLGDTQGNFSGLDAPLILKKLPKVTGQYRKFQIMSAGFYTRAVKQAFAGASKEERAIGSRMILWKLSHTAVAAGALGLPLVNFANMIYNAVKGDDEPDDMETKLRGWIGDEDTADLLLHGALAKTTGLDMSAKMGEDKTFSLMPYSDVKLDSKAGIAQTAAELAGGPAMAQLERMASGVGYMEQGDMYKGIEKFMPKGMESAMKAFRLANEGYTMKNGDVIVKPEDISDYALALQALGLPTTEINKMTRNQAVQYQVNKYFHDHTHQIEKDYVKAFDEGDTDKMAELRSAWMDLQDSKDAQRKHFGGNPQALKRQPISNLLKAPTNVAKRQQLEQEEMAGAQ